MTRLSTSEARAEAVTIVLQILMRRRMTQQECAEVYAQALEEGAEIGDLNIADEIAWLFDLPEAEADMLSRDGCS